MKTFNFNLSEGTIKKLSDIHENYIKIRHISSDSFDSLEQQFIIKTSYPDGSIFSNIISCGAYITPSTREPKIDIEYQVEDCHLTEIEAVKKDIRATYIFYYETLDDILNNITKIEKEIKIQIGQEVNNWVTKVEELLKGIIEWLKPYEQRIKVIKSKILINEEISGEYITSALDVIILDTLTLRFEPIGTFIIGCKGRIDIKTNLKLFDSYQLVLQPIGNTEKWYIIKNRDSSLKKEFTQSQLIMLIDNAIKTKGH